MKKRTVFLIVIGGFLAILGLIAAIFLLVDTLLDPIGDVVTEVMTAWQETDYETMFAAMAPALQDQMRDPSYLGSLTREYNVQPESWSFNSRSQQNADAIWQGSVTLANGNKHDITIRLIEYEGIWRVSGVDIADAWRIG